MIGEPMSANIVVSESVGDVDGEIAPHTWFQQLQLAESEPTYVLLSAEQLSPHVSHKRCSHVCGGSVPRLRDERRVANAGSAVSANGDEWNRNDSGDQRVVKPIRSRHLGP